MGKSQRLAPDRRMHEGLQRAAFGTDATSQGVHEEGFMPLDGRVEPFFAADLEPKPELHGYRKLLEQFGIEPTRALMAEDMVRNLAPAKQLGMTTVWVDTGSERGSHGY